MMSRIRFDRLYENEFVFKSEEEVISFFKEMKDVFCKDLLEKNIPLMTLNTTPLFGRIKIEVVDFVILQSTTSYSCKGTFNVVGDKTGIIFDTINVELYNVNFLKKVNSVSEYLASTFKLRYSGYMTRLEDIEEHSRISQKPLENSRIININSIKQQRSEDSVSELVFQVAKEIKNQHFEVHYKSSMNTQSVFCFYDGNHEAHMDYLKYLVESTKTYDINIRVIDNEAIELYKLSKGTYKPNIRKIHA